MTTIRSTRGQAALSNIRPSNANPALTHIDVEAWGEVDECATFVTADLLAALDAVPVAEANQSIEHELAQRDRAERDLRRVRAELDLTRETYESELAEAERCEREALEKATALAAERDRLLSTIERIDAVRRDFYEIRGDWAHPQGAAALKAQMERAILGDPPFELPTEAGARFEAVDNCGKLSVFEAVHDGPDIHYLNRRTYVIWSGGNVLEYCRGHRLIGADQ